MISDKERREVAKGLRNLAGKYVTLGELERVLGVDITSPDVDLNRDAKNITRLADLIDRPTCTVVSVVFRGDYDEYEVELSCGDSIRWLGTAKDLAFCPNCGAEVVE